MAKSTKAQEATTGTADSYNTHEMNDPEPPVVVTRAMLGEVPPSATATVGGVSSASSEPTTPSDDKNEHSGQGPAPSAESPSSPQGEFSTAPLTDGSGTASSHPDDDDILPYEEWSYADLQAECKDRGLTAGGKTEDLIARLKASDEEAEA